MHHFSYVVVDCQGEEKIDVVDRIAFAIRYLSDPKLDDFLATVHDAFNDKLPSILFTGAYFWPRVQVEATTRVT